MIIKLFFFMLSLSLMVGCQNDNSFSNRGQDPTEIPEPEAEDTEEEVKGEEQEKPKEKRVKKKKNKIEPQSKVAAIAPKPRPKSEFIAPVKAVTKGSFTVYTEPSDPAPFQSYNIVILVELPSNVTYYSKADLTGEVVGTDMYRQEIGPDAKKVFSPKLQKLIDPFDEFFDGQFFGPEFEVNGDKAKLRVYVPGGAQLVQDTVTIRSKLLKEEQELIITF